MAVFGYVRVSTMRQAEDGESLDLQERTIAGYAMMHGSKVSQTFVEGGVSGSVPLAERAQGKAMLAALNAGDVVITAKMTRMLTRTPDAFEALPPVFPNGRSWRPPQPPRSCADRIRLHHSRPINQSVEDRHDEDKE